MCVQRISHTLQVDKAVEIYNTMKEAFVRPDTFALNSLLAVCVKAGEMKKAIEVFRENIAAGVRPDAVTFNTLIRGCAQAGMEDDAHRLHSEMLAGGLEPDLYTYTSLITCAGNSKRLDQAFAFWRELCQQNIQPDTLVCNALMSAYQKSECYSEATHLYRQMRNYGIACDVYTYNAGIIAASSVEEAFACLAQMLQDGILPDATSFSSIIRVCARHADYSVALQVMCTCCPLHALPSYSCSGYLQVPSMIRAAKLTPDIAIFNALIACCTKGSLFREAEEIYQHLSAANVHADLVTFNSLISAAAQQAHTHKALAYFREMLSRDLKPDIVTFAGMVTVLSKAGRAGEAHKMFLVMQEQGLSPNLLIFSTLIGAMAKAGWTDDAFNIFADMGQFGIIPDTVAYNAVLSACQGPSAFAKAMSLYHQMKDAGTPPDCNTLGQLLRACAVPGRLQSCGPERPGNNDNREAWPPTAEALNIWNTFECQGVCSQFVVVPERCFYDISSGVIAGELAFNMLIACHMDADRALGVYQSMVNRQLQASFLTYLLLLNVVVRARRIDRLVDITFSACATWNTDKPQMETGFPAGVLSCVSSEACGHALLAFVLHQPSNNGKLST